MGRRGPKAQPTNVKRLHGHKPSRINDSEPVPGGESVDPPEWLSAEAMAVWHRLAPDLEAQGVLTPWDVDAFAVLCDAVAQYQQASRLVAKAGVLIKGRKDSAVKNPAMQIVRDCSQTIRSYAAEFGMTPSARSGISLSEEIDGHDAARLLT